ncbi:MAG: phosphoribosylformylglycinamidine synthase subunit PurL [Spirochaetales bacterium]|nr:phosphoribosylformylglycinamidine synthase subunit PurL [Spirochaetales bacterium]
MRCEIFYKNQFGDGRADHLLKGIQKDLGLPLKALKQVDVFLLEDHPELDQEAAAEIFLDQVAQEMLVDHCAGSSDLLPGWDFMIETAFRPGVTDQVALTAYDAVKNYLGLTLKANFHIQTASKYLVAADGLSAEQIEKLSSYLYNPLIQRAGTISRGEWEKGERFPSVYPYKVAASDVEVHKIDTSLLSQADLVNLSKKRLLALSLDEMKAVQNYFADPEVQAVRKKFGLGAEATDVELEMIAQTWSEHCKHKIFNATIEYENQESGETTTIKSIFKNYIKKTTDEVAKVRHFLRSVFHDNSGVIQFDDETCVCFKVETHNSPSALDPYGGAITGIVGVNRDIIGTGMGAKPIFNTNVLCFGDPNTPDSEIPKGILHPRQVMSGVHKGIIDGGNQSGIPVVGGAFLFDESYKGKPLVYCGTGGILPARIKGQNSWDKEIKPGDLAVMTGGRIGKDGIHGATFSSQALDEESPVSAVQIGDPITQKKMLDFLLEARDKGLYRAMTDNGAGGLSSSLGEMAEFSGGVKIELDKCPLKYQGLAPWEILVSESQERMSLAVAPENLPAFMALAEEREVEATVVGEFIDTGNVEILYEGKYVGLLSMKFLHDGLPEMKLKALWPKKVIPAVKIDDNRDLTQDLETLLADPTIASKEKLVRQYDHEVQAQSVIKPFAGEKMDAPSDGAVIRPKPGSYKGLTITHGVCQRYGDVDAYDMAACALDEAFRAHIALGGNPEEASALDNFCWPDPVEAPGNPDGAYKLAQLVRSCQGLMDTCVAYSVPLISGKDSMKNDAVLEGKKISVRPTLLVSLMGTLPDVRKAVNTDFKQAGDLIYILGETRGELGGTFYEKMLKNALGPCPKVDTKSALALYAKLYKAIQAGQVKSCHDLSDGGLAVALAESAMGGCLGVECSLDQVPGAGQMENSRALFCETPSRFIVSVSPGDQGNFEKTMAGSAFGILGKVTGNQGFVINRGNKEVLKSRTDNLSRIFKGVF